MSRFAIVIGILTIASSYWCDARAETPARFDVLLDGDAFFSSAVVHQNTDAGVNNPEFMDQLRLRVTPTVNADDGVTYGASMRLRASLRSGVADADLAYLFTRGGFGTVELGVQYDPNLAEHVIAPSNFGTGGIDGDWAIGSVGWIQNQSTFLEPYFGGGYTVTTFVKEADRINYLTPRLLSDGDPIMG